MGEKTYLAIDLKSFYASVECVSRGLDPLDAYLVVADESRTEKTICLAVSPALKAYGIPGRARLFEVNERLRSVNAARRLNAPEHHFAGEAHLQSEARANSRLAIRPIIAPPRMAHYIATSARIYSIYLKYVSPDDIHVYSVDEVFIDATEYLLVSGLSAHDFAKMMILDVLRETGITATAGVGENLYLAKIAMDIGAKRILLDKNGVRIAELTEQSYREKLWDHRPLTDFWRVGRGIARKLESRGLFTMGDIARQSIQDEDALYDLFGINAELLIDHAWGAEPCTMQAIKAYRPEASSFGSGQVLPCTYSAEKARLVLIEMADALALSLLEKHLATDSIFLNIGYERGESGETSLDRYGRRVPKPAHGTIRLDRPTSSTRRLTDAAVKLYDRIVDSKLGVRRLNLTALNVIDEDSEPIQLDMFSSLTDDTALEQEKRRQQAVLSIKKKFGKNAILRGTSLVDGATGRARNDQIGGHKA